MQGDAVIIIICITILLIAVIVLFFETGKLKGENKRLQEENKKLQEENNTLRETKSREIQEAREQSVAQSRLTIKGQIAEQVATVLPGFPYNPSDCRFLGDPIDYVIFVGYTDFKDRGKRDSLHSPKTLIKVVFADVKTGNQDLKPHQKLIAQAIHERNVEFVVLRVGEDGAITVEEWSPPRRRTKSRTEVSDNGLPVVSSNTGGKESEL